MKIQNNIRFIIAIILALLLFFYFILGLSGMLSILGILLLFVVPIYLILNNFDLGMDEKLAFSFFIGTGIFPSIAYWIGMFTSFKTAIVMTFIILLLAAFLFAKFKTWKKNQ